MADLTITAANVVPVDGYGWVDLVAGATITAGQACYEDSNNKAQLAAADAAGKTTARGIALNNASNGQPVRLMNSGDLDLGATLTVGEIYCLSTTAAGGIMPEGDLVSADVVSILGVATATNNLKMQIVNSGAVVP